MSKFQTKRDHRKQKAVPALWLFLTSIFVMTSMTKLAYADDYEKCHVYIGTAGVVVDVRSHVKAQYSASKNFCKDALPGYVCLSYFESEEGCTVSDDSLVDLFLKDARSMGLISD